MFSSPQEKSRKICFIISQKILFDHFLNLRIKPISWATFLREVTSVTRLLFQLCRYNSRSRQRPSRWVWSRQTRTPKYCLIPVSQLWATFFLKIFAKFNCEIEQLRNTTDFCCRFYENVGLAEFYLKFIYIYIISSLTRLALYVE